MARQAEVRQGTPTPKTERIVEPIRLDPGKLHLSPKKMTGPKSRVDAGLAAKIRTSRRPSG
jgi:hypothetical protein